MPFITGYGRIPITSIIPTTFVLDSTPGDESYVLSTPDTTGSLIYTFDCNGAIELFDSSSNSLGFVEVINLPVDFLIDAILTRQSLLPNPVAVFYTASTPTILSLSTSVPSWDGLVSSWSSAFQDSLYDPFTISVSFELVGDPSSVISGSETNAINYDTLLIPTNVFVFTFSGTFEAISAPPTNPVLEPVPGPTEVEVTLPPGTTGVIVETVPTPPVTIPAGPGPITIPIPPGTTVIIVTPTAPPGPGSSLIIPVDYPIGDVLLTINLALDAITTLIGNPSGIYTLVPNQRFDVLYERAAGTTTTQTVQIPRPFGITSYVPEND